MEKDTLDTAISLLCELHSMGYTEDYIKEVIIQMYKIVDDTKEQDTYDIKGRIKALDKLIDKALDAMDRNAFTKYTRERNMLKLEL